MLVGSWKVDQVSHEFPLEQIEKAFAPERRAPNVLKTVETL